VSSFLTARQHKIGHSVYPTWLYSRHSLLWDIKYFLTFFVKKNWTLRRQPTPSLTPVSEESNRIESNQIFV